MERGASPAKNRSSVQSCGTRQCEKRAVKQEKQDEVKLFFHEGKNSKSFSKITLTQRMEFATIIVRKYREKAE